MKRVIILAALAALGLSTFAPSAAEAGGFSSRIDVRYRDEDRNEHRDWDRSCDESDAPRRVIRAAYELGNGRSIRSIRHVHRWGRTFYIINMDARHKVDLELKITEDGRVLDLDRDPNGDGR
jgi:Ni/Co efflux regulator RcnB